MATKRAEMYLSYSFRYLTPVKREACRRIWCQLINFLKNRNYCIHTTIWLLFELYCLFTVVFFTYYQITVSLFTVLLFTLGLIYQGAYYRRPRHSYYAMKAKQEPVSRFDISWYTWTKFLFTVCFSDFVTDFNLASCLCWAESRFLAGNRKWVGP